MTPEQFCYWLQGKLEGRKFDNSELVAIQEHLATVFHKVTPNRNAFEPHELPRVVPPADLDRHFNRHPDNPWGTPVWCGGSGQMIC